MSKKTYTVLSNIKHNGSVYTLGQKIVFDEKEAEKLVGVIEEEKPEETKAVALEDMSVKELREYADEFGISIPAGKKKSEILEILSAKDGEVNEGKEKEESEKEEKEEKKKEEKEEEDKTEAGDDL